MFSAGYAVRAAHEAPPGRLLPLLSRHQPLCNDRLQWVALSQSLYARAAVQASSLAGVQSSDRCPSQSSRMRSFMRL
jgi:hypothetical protein